MVTTAREQLERRIASVTYGYRYLSLEGALRRIAANGFEAVEIVGTRPHMLPEDFPAEDLAAIAALLAELNLRVVAIAPFSAGIALALHRCSRTGSCGHDRPCQALRGSGRAPRRSRRAVDHGRADHPGRPAARGLAPCARRPACVRRVRGGPRRAHRARGRGRHARAQLVGDPRDARRRQTTRASGRSTISATPTWCAATMPCARPRCSCRT